MGNGTQAVEVYRLALKRGLNPRHREAMRRLVAGQPVGRVAEDLGYNVGHLNKIIRSPLFKRELERMQAKADLAHYDALAKLRCIHPKAVEAYTDLVEQTDFKQLRFNVAKDIFDRTGVEAAKTTQHREVVETYEQRLASAKATYKVTTTDTCPIDVIGGEDLLKNYDKE